MKILRYVVWLLPLVWGLSACGSDDDEEEKSQGPVKYQIATGETRDIGLTTVTLLGTVDTPALYFTEVGIAYCLESNMDNVIRVKATAFELGDNNRSYSVKISGLLPDTTYVYFAYMKDNSGILYSANERLTFRTKSPAGLLKTGSIGNVTSNSASFTCHISDQKVYDELTKNKQTPLFGVAWSTEKSRLTIVDEQFMANMRFFSFDGGLETTVKFSRLNSSSTYYYRAYMSLNGKIYPDAVKSFVTLENTEVDTGKVPEGVEAVDLGLPSGTKWANMNIGAEKPEDYGLYFSWGETVGYEPNESDGHSFNWQTYQLCGGTYDKMKKYCTKKENGVVDNMIVLELEDDAAHVNWGGGWLMPTNEEIEELCNNTVFERMTLNGVYGCKLTSKTNGNYIFLPAAGCRFMASMYDQDEIGFYWSASLYADTPFCAHYFGFDMQRSYVTSHTRYYGLTIRPVLEK